MLTKQDLDQIGNIVKAELKTEITKQLKPIKQAIVQIRKDLQERVERLEEHLNLPPLSKPASQ